MVDNAVSHMRVARTHYSPVLGELNFRRAVADYESRTSPHPCSEKDLASYCNEKGIWLVCDEVYSMFTYEKPHISLRAATEKLDIDPRRDKAHECAVCRELPSSRPPSRYVGPRDPGSSPG